MTDLEMTKLCAEASEVWKIAHEWYPTMTLDATFKGVEVRGEHIVLVPNNPFRQDPQVYDPLHDDAQAMALVKKFRLDVYGYPSYWAALHDDGTEHARADNQDLNRAIVECVAKMQAAR